MNNEKLAKGLEDFIDIDNVANSLNDHVVYPCYGVAPKETE